MADISIGGLASGIDTDTIIAGLLKIQQRQLDQITVKKTAVETKQTAYQSLQTQLVALRTAGLALASPISSPFDTRTVSVSKPDALIATASAKANSGTYQVKVNAVAAAHQVSSQAFADADSAITSGTFTIRIGSQTAAEITIDSSNNTLTGLADAINFANVGVNAGVVQDASSGYRLILTSTRTGTDNQITIDNQLSASTGGAVRPEFDFDNPVQQATDASVTLGSGPGAITVTSSTNTVSNLINGVTLNLLDANPDQTISITVNADTEKATSAVKDFVNAYNSILDFIDSQTKYDTESDIAGVLQGDYSAINIRRQLQSAMQNIVPGVSSKANRLSVLGIVTGNDGRLTINETQLQSVISGTVEGITSSDLRRLFAMDGQSTNGNITFLFAGSKTRESTTPYQVNITTAAERATITGANSVSEITVIDETNDTLKLNLDGTETTISLVRGSYSREQLAQQVESAINGSRDLVGRAVSVGITPDNKLSITSDSYGASSRVTIYASSAVSALGFNGGESDIGVDVAGHFVVNGVIEEATGSGRTLTGKEGNAHTDGLQVRVTLTPAQIGVSSEGSITITRGVASRLNAVIDKLMDSQRGTLTTLNDSFQRQLASLQATMEKQQARFDRQKDQLTARFIAMESALQQLQSTSSMLGAQLQSIGRMAPS